MFIDIYTRSARISPTIWGTCQHFMDWPRKRRFIPTPVGNMTYLLFQLILLTVHPHACGEHRITVSSIQPSVGSSPRLWGTFGRRNAMFPAARFIPTPVGNILSSKIGIMVASVHPHACGEHVICSYSKAASSGSSPRLWGTCATRPL